MTSVPKELVSGCADKAALVAVARNYSPDAVYPAPAPEVVKGEDWTARGRDAPQYRELVRIVGWTG